MRTLICFIVLASGAVTACKPAPPPQRAEGIDPTFEGSEDEKRTMAVEAALIAAYPGLAVRNDRDLTIFHKGEQITSYRNDPTGCQRYFLTGVLKLRDKAGDTYPVAGVTCHFANSENTYLVLPNSDKYLVHEDASASPDGRYLVSGFDRADKTQGSLAIAEWPKVRDVVIFPAHCKGIVWRDGTHFSATCWHNDGPNEANPYDSFAFYFKAEISLDAAGKWQMVATQWVDRDTYQPKTVDKPLYHFTAVPPPAPHFDKST
ncbi:hypothetical protein [Asticcacaulis sp. 201]|uniref:hypothetical protein n=1 Tax=Asticcacaulis sp. 201 TaxID=3028787 RepID=UPI002916DE11|nr:hypothetical protein [Asticcacaulis sp. 201]MDV6329432.1 hypothetical protein [Asticcacaulis sp. 201]